MNDLTFFDNLPLIGPKSLWEEGTRYQMNDIISGINKLFKDNFNSIYPYDIYNKVDKKGNKIATIIQIAAAGFSKDECLISIKGNVLTLKMEKNKKTEEKEPEFTKEYIEKKIAYRTTTLSWSLSNTCDKKNIVVSYKDGVLTIEMPIIQPQQPQETILKIK